MTDASQGLRRPAARLAVADQGGIEFLVALADAVDQPRLGALGGARAQTRGGGGNGCSGQAELPEPRAGGWAGWRLDQGSWRLHSGGGADQPEQLDAAPAGLGSCRWRGWWSDTAGSGPRRPAAPGGRTRGSRRGRASSRTAGTAGSGRRAGRSSTGSRRSCPCARRPAPGRPGNTGPTAWPAAGSAGSGRGGAWPAACSARSGRRNGSAGPPGRRCSASGGCATAGSSGRTVRPPGAGGAGGSRRRPWRCAGRGHSSADTVRPGRGRWPRRPCR